MNEQVPSWIRPVLRVAAAYNLLWGGLVIIAPLMWFRIFGMEAPRYPEIWQCVGMIVGLYGLGYWIASLNPFRHWPIVLIGLLGKLFGPIGFLIAAWQGNLPWSFGLILVFNDLIWWVPFSIILYHAFRWNSNPLKNAKCPTYQEAVRLTRSQRGETLEKLSFRKLTMVIFLRHAGCTFCRETLSELQIIRDRVVDENVSVAIVHMGHPLDGTKMLSKYGLDTFHHFSDPTCRLYRAFGLERGSWSQLFSWRILKRGLGAGIKGGHGIGKIAGDSFQLPGVYFLNEGQLVLSFPTKHAAEQINYLELIAVAKQNVSRKHGNDRDSYVDEEELAKRVSLLK